MSDDRCLLTHPSDGGRRCERPVGHEGAHRCQLTRMLTLDWVYPATPSEPTPRAKLLKLLTDVADGNGGNLSQVHVEAENLLLQILGDAEITDAWADASGQWWYA